MARSPAPKGGTSALEALVDAASGILAADSLSGTLGGIAHHLATVVAYDDLALYDAEMLPVFAVGELVPAARDVVAVPLIAHD